MGDHKRYPEGQRPSDYKPYKSPATLAKTAEIDTGLEELCDLQVGTPLSQKQIADYCGCSQQLIHLVERSARRKLKERLARIGVVPLPGSRGLDLRAAMRALG